MPRSSLSLYSIMSSIKVTQVNGSSVIGNSHSAGLDIEENRNTLGCKHREVSMNIHSNKKLFSWRLPMIQMCTKIFHIY